MASSCTKTLDYDTYSRVKTVGYSDSGFVERRGYSAFGHWIATRNNVTGGRYWLANAFEADGRVKTITYGNGLTTERTYREDRGGVVDSVHTGTSADPNRVQNLQYYYEPGREGSLYQRLDFNNHVAEGFEYDPLARLARSYFGSVATNSTDITFTKTTGLKYDASGNILEKNVRDSTDAIVVSESVGTYNYFDATERGVAHGAHAIKSIGTSPQYTYDDNGNLKTAGDLTVTWMPFDQPHTISRTGGTATEYVYGAELQRVRQFHGDERIDYLSPEHEVRQSGAVTQYVHYMMSPFGRLSEITINTSKKVTDARYFHQDHLGSIDAISAADGTNIAQSYDAWGVRRSGATWQAEKVTPIERRGYTDHEHLDDVGLINMNGRVYDPRLGRFLSVDPLYDRLYQTQGVNAYSYVRNNPVSYTDPTGLVSSADKYVVANPNGPIVMDPVRASTSGLSWASQFGMPTLGATGGVASPWTPRTNRSTLNPSFLNGGLTCVGSGGVPMMSSDPATPEESLQYQSDDMASIEFLSGVAAGWHEDANPFATEVVPFSPANSRGVFVGHLVSLYVGAQEGTWGGGLVLGSGALEFVSRGGATPVALPAAALGAAAFGHGANTGRRSLQHLLKMDMRGQSGGIKGPSGEVSTQKYLEKRWDKATFPSSQNSIEYHLKKHWPGHSAVEYTQRAMQAFSNPNGVHSKGTDLLGRDAVKVRSVEGAGLFTPQGRIIWFQPK